ncbi:MAG: hypothetical protein H6658_03500 [Ardenticatenaceae bacterium]|nr:hypothetical protein [Ardenticatenaceae bacterium]
MGGGNINLACLDSENYLMPPTPPAPAVSDPANIPTNVAKLTADIRPFLDGIHMLMIVSALVSRQEAAIALLAAQIAQTQGVFTLALVAPPTVPQQLPQPDSVPDDLTRLRAMTDALILLPLARLGEENGRSPMPETAQNYICWAVKAICTLLRPGLVNIDFSALQTVLKTDGPIFLGGHCASGPDRAVQAVQHAMYSPPMDLSIHGAHNILLQIQTGAKFYLWEFTEIINRIKEQIHTNANLTFGTLIDPEMGDTICLTILASKFD